MQKRKKSTGKSSVSKAVLQAGGALLCGLAFAAVLLCALAMVCCKVDIPEDMLLPLSTFAAALAVLPAGMIIAAMRGEKGMLWGLAIGAAFFGILWVAALIQGQTSFTVLSAIKVGTMMTSGALGGSLGIMLRERRRRIR